MFFNKNISFLIDYLKKPFTSFLFWKREKEIYLDGLLTGFYYDWKWGHAPYIQEIKELLEGLKFIIVLLLIFACFGATIVGGALILNHFG